MTPEEHEKRVERFKATICAMEQYGDTIKKECLADFEGPHQEAPVFRFIEGVTLRKEMRDFCTALFAEFFPKGKQGSL